MRCGLIALPLLIFALWLTSNGEDKQTTISPPDSLVMPVFSSAASSVDSLNLQHGDSIFIFGGELYYRARSGGKDFFVSRDTLVAHADSLVVYQYYRLNPNDRGAQGSDSSLTKVARHRCNMLTQSGSRCKRLAMPGSDRCWQHKK